MEAIFAEMKANDQARVWNGVKASIRNAISTLEDGDHDEGIAELKEIIGDVE